MGIIDVFYGLFMLVIVGVLVYVIYDLFNRGAVHARAQESRILAKIEQIAKIVTVADQSDLGLAKELLNTASFTTINFKKPVCVPYLIETISTLLDSVEVIRVQVIDWQGLYVLRITAEGIQHLLLIDSHEAKPKYYATDKFVLSEWLKDDTLTVATSMRLIVPLQECDGQCQVGIIESIKEAIELAALKGMEEPREDNTLKIYELIEQMGALRFSKTEFEYLKLAPPLTRLSFDPINLTLGNERYAVQADQTIEFFSDELKAGRNVLILGPVGTGKTSFSTNIIANLGDKTAMIRLDETTLATLDSPAGKSAFHSFMSQQKLLGTELVVFFVDEGQRIAKSEHLTPLLEMMAGLKSSTVKTAVLAALSSPKASLDPALVRKGRAHHIVELAPLGEKKAKALADFIQKNTAFVLNHGQLNELVKKPATLADVWGCFSEKESVSKWAEIFYKYKVQSGIPAV